MTMNKPNNNNKNATGKTTAAGNLTGLEIAVIGMAGKFPGASNIDEFWEVLEKGRETITFLTEQDLKEMGLGPETMEDPNYVNSLGGRLEGKEYFDSNFFDYTPREAEILDPQVRQFHQVVWSALEDAGVPVDTNEAAIGVYAGGAPNFHWEAMMILAGKGREMGQFAAEQLANRDYIATRVSYKLNLKGPAVAVHSACSTSLTAVHMACRALLTGECKIALAGGASITYTENAGYIYHEGMLSSPDGHCRAFDVDSAGTAFGDGIAAVVLKQYKAAVKDGDHIYAMVKGSAVNNDGNRKVGFNAPSVKGQMEVIRAAHKFARVKPESIQFIEAHGTGTPLGDPIEVKALIKAFDTDKKDICALGSVKTNVGHLGTAAGVTGFIKTVLVLKHKKIPPTLHFNTPNPKLGMENGPFYVNNTLKEWKSETSARRAAVSSLGLGGTNAHIVLEEAPMVQRQSSPARENQLVILSAKTSSALEIMSKNLATHLGKRMNSPEDNNGESLADIAYTLQEGRCEFHYRRFQVCTGLQDAAEAFEKPVAEENTYRIVDSEEEKPVVFMFSGQGSQYVGMGRDLCRQEPVFRKEVDRCAEILEKNHGYDIMSILYPDEESEDAREKINHVLYSGPVKFTIEYALAKQLMEWGIVPAAMIGHSFGEYAAAALADVFSLEDALKLVVLRGKVMEKTPPGAMMSVSLPEEELKKLLPEEISLAAVNTANLCIVSGPTAAVDRFEKQLTEAGHDNLRINFPRASHSHLMESIRNEFEAAVRQVPLKAPAIPYIAGLTGDWAGEDTAAEPSYWGRHLVETIRFADGLDRLQEKTGTIYIQMGSDRGLPLFVNRHPGMTPQNLTVNLIRHPKDKLSDQKYLMETLGRIWLRGAHIDWKQIRGEEKRFKQSLPTYPFEGQRFWLDGDVFRMAQQALIGNAGETKRESKTDWYHVPTWKPSLLPAVPESIQQDGAASRTILHFATNNGLAGPLKEKLEQQGLRVVEVKKGEQYRAEGQTKYEINPAERSHYDCLWTALRKNGTLPDGILYCWSVLEAGDQPVTPDGIDEAVLLSVGAPISMLQTMGHQKLDTQQEYRLWMVTDSMQKLPGHSVRHPESAMATALIKVIAKEYANIKPTAVDMDFASAGSHAREEALEMLAQEIAGENPDPRQPVIAYRGRERMVQAFEELPLPQMEETPALLKENGVYLITGGVSGIGLELADYLARQMNARLALLRRSPFPGKDLWEKIKNEKESDDEIVGKIKRLEEMEANGADIRIYAADVSDPETMSGVIDDIKRQYGRIDGVIHSAGVPEGSIIQRKEADGIQRELAAKVKGTVVLHHLLKDEKPDFIVYCSSYNSIMPNIGQAGYAAGNAYLDASAHYHTARGTQTMAIGWNRWRGTGMSAAIEAKHKERSGEDFVDALTAEEGVEAFERIIGHLRPPMAQIIVSAVDFRARLDRYMTTAFGHTKTGTTGENKEQQAGGTENETAVNLFSTRTKYKRPQLSTDYVEPRDPLEQKMAEIWQDLFGIENIGIDDDFFELGGDSLQGMTMINRTKRLLKENIGITAVFEFPNIFALAENFRQNYPGAVARITGGSTDSEETSLTETLDTIKPAEKKPMYPLSSAQKRLYFIQQMDPENTGYNISSAVVIEGNLSSQRQQQAFRNIIERHESFRTTFEMHRGEPVQIIHDRVDFSIDVLDGKNGGIPQILRNYTERFGRFQLDKAPLMRIGLAELDENRQLLVVQIHHIIADAASLGILVNEFIRQLLGIPQPPVNIQYKDYAVWQNSETVKNEIKRQESFWLERFDGEIPRLNLPYDYPRPEKQNFEGAEVKAEIAAPEVKALKQLALTQEVTLYMLMLAIFEVVLSKVCGQEDIILGTPTAGRKSAELESVIGMFVNTVVLRNKPAANESFSSFLAKVKKETLAAFANQDYQFDDLVDRVVKKRDTSRNPIFDVLFTLRNHGMITGEPTDEYVENVENVENVEKPEFELIPQEMEKNIAKFDLGLGVDVRDNILLTIKYAVKLFNEDTVQRLLDYIKETVQNVLENSNVKLENIALTHEYSDSSTTVFQEDEGDFGF
jgi:acyl transferase domain-containing protein